MRIHEVELLAGDLAALNDFYGRVLDLPVLYSDSASLTIRIGTSRLVFHAAPDGWHGIYHVAFNIPENQLDAARQWLSARVPLLVSPDGTDTFFFPDWNAHAVYFADPAGNILELIARHTLPTADERPISAASLLSISEIGLAAADVPATVQELHTALSVPIYRGAGSPDFTAVGDEEGLLIVVRHGRGWFPDFTRLAELCSTAVTISSSDGSRHRIDGPPWTVAS